MTNMRLNLKLIALCVALVGPLMTAPAHAERIKDLASIGGVRQNQLSGYGIVVGLDGTGDQTTQTPFTVQSIMAMLQQKGVVLPQGTQQQLKNVAAVMVTASQPAFAQPGQTLDITVSSTLVADARVEYRTNSQIDRAEVSSMLSRFFQSMLPF